MPVAKPENPYASAWAGFQRETAEHRLVVLREDGLYRHLRVQEPGTRMWSWDIITWPGHLATSGDIADGYMFTRLPDMLDFFDRPAHLRDYYADGAPCIDVRYWAEKLCDGRSHEVKKYEPESFLRQVREHLEEHDEFGTDAQAFRDRQLALLERIRQLRHRTVGEDSPPTVAERLERHWRGDLSAAELFSTDGLTQSEADRLDEEFRVDENGDRAPWDLFDLEADVARALPADRRQEVFDEARWHADSGSEAHKWLAENEEHVGSDTFEWDLREYDIGFLLACYAIDMAVQLYRQHQSTPTPEASHA